MAPEKMIVNFIPDSPTDVSPLIRNETTVVYDTVPHHNSSCPMTEADMKFQFVFNGIIIGALCVFGVVGNTLSILVLQRDPNNKVAIYLLQALAVADNLLLLVSFMALSIWKGFLPYLYADKDSLRSSMVYIPILINPLGAMTQTATVWTTVLLALNRYLAVCKPYRAPILCTLKRAKLQVLCVMVFAVCFNLPRFFQHDIVPTTKHKLNAEGELVNITMLTLEPTVLGDHSPFGIVYTNALYTILVLILPMLLLVGLNTRLILELRRSRRRHSNTPHNHGIPAPSDENISVIMIIIIVVFIICQTPDRIFQIFAVLIFRTVNCSQTKERLVCMCNLLVIINSSTNFIIYYMFRRSFRRILKQRLCHWNGMDEPESPSSVGSIKLRLRIASLTKDDSTKKEMNGSAVVQENSLLKSKEQW